MFVRAVFLLIGSTDLLTGFDHGFFFHGVVVAVKAKADSHHQSDDKEDRKTADIDTGLNL